MTLPEHSPRLSEDWLAVFLGLATLAVSIGATAWLGDGAANPLTPWLAAPTEWVASPLEGLIPSWRGVVGVALATLTLYGLAQPRGKRRAWGRGFAGVFLLGLLAMTLARQQVVNQWGLEYALWAIVIGMAISNTVGCPRWLAAAAQPELYTKVGLVLLGGEVLLGQLAALGPPGVCISWVVTPIVVCATYWFGQRVLRIESRTLNIVVAADMAVCGVSAAIATAAACRAKKEELSVAIGLSLAFTALMMVVMPPVVVWMGLGPVIGGAWIGGTIDSTGAVSAAGAMLGDTGLVVASTVKMIQNVLVGFVALGVSAYWVTVVERGAGERLGVGEVWRRFPKFVLGFFAASLVCSWLHAQGGEGRTLVEQSIGVTKVLRNWCFCLSFTSVGLLSDFRVLGHHLRGGKPLALYVCGQALNLALSLAMSYAVFTWLFPGAADALTRR